MDSDDEETQVKTTGPKFPIQMYISEGNKYMRLAKYDTAIEFFNAALEKEPGNQKSLIGRSRCYMQMTKFSEAKEDAEEALRAQPKSCDAKMLIGEIDYCLGDFEKGFLTFYRGFVKRKNHVGLKLGHQMSRKAIDNALHPDRPITIDEQDIKNLDKLLDRLDSELSIKTRAIKDQFTSDIDFVSMLLEDETVNSIHPYCEFLKSYLKDRQVFWKTQNPKTSM